MYNYNFNNNYLGMVFDMDWFATPFVLMTCQVKNLI